MRVSGPLAGPGHVLWIVPVCLGMLHLIEHSRTGWSRSGNISHHRRDGTRAERVGTTVRTVSEQQPPGVLYKGFRHRLVLRGCPAGSTRVSEHHAHKKQELMSSCSAVRPFCLFRCVPPGCSVYVPSHSVGGLWLLFLFYSSPKVSCR